MPLERILTSTAKAVGPHVPDSTKNSLRAGLASLVVDNVITYRELARCDETRIWWFGMEEVHSFSHPTYYNELPPEICRLIGDHRSPRPFVLQVQDVVVKGMPGFKRTSDGRHIVYNFWKGSDRRAGNAFASDVLAGAVQGAIPDIGRRSNDVRSEMDVAVPLLGKWIDNYTHWKQEGLALLEGVEEYRAQTGNDPMLLVPPDPPSFIPESLELFGYSADEYTEIDGRVRVDKLVLPSVRRFLSDTSDDYIRMPSGVKWLRDRAVAGVTSGDASYPSKILISREDASGRRISNRAETAAALSDIGFETYVPGEMSYAEQVRLFSQADFVVGTHGAGMGNSIYLSEACVLELYGDHFLPANYEFAQGLELTYGCLWCEGSNSKNDIVVDTDELVCAVRALEAAN